MNSARLRILINIVRQNPAAIKQVQQEINQLNRTTAMGGAAAGKLFGAFGRLEKLGKDLQWTGRQLEFRFTLPLILAGAAATKFAFANERAFTELRKVYQGAGQTFAQVNADLADLRKGFELLSNLYGVQQDEVITIGKVWAEAGLAGTDLAKAVRATLDVMILGNFGYEQASRALIVLRAQYGLTSNELKKALAVINVINISTAVSFQDLIDGITRAGGTARTVGVDIRHLSALISAMVPATGSAASAGNGLKTIFSRLFAPTKQAAEVMKLAGINIHDATWQAKNGAERLEFMSHKFVKLTPAQQAYFSSFVAGRFQINRMDVLLRDIANPMGNYEKSLKNTADEAKNLAQYQKEIAIQLASSPQAFKQLTTVIENQLARAIVPLIPTIISVVHYIASLVTWFTNLSPEVQKTALSLLVFLAAVGPIIAYIGAFILMFSVLKKGFVSFGNGIFWAAKQIAGFIGWLLKLIGVGAAGTTATETAVANAEAASVAIEEVVAQSSAAIITLGAGAGEGYIGGMVAAIEAGIPEVVAAIYAEMEAIGVAGSNSAFLLGGAIGEAFEAGILAAMEVGTAAKIAAVEAQLAAVAAAGVAGAATGGAAIGAALEVATSTALVSAAPAVAGSSLVVGEAIVDGVLVPLSALPAGAAAAFTDVIDVVGIEAATVGTEIAGGMSAGLTVGLIGLAAAVGAGVTFLISKTSDSLLQTLRGMWLTFFMGLPGFLINMFDRPIGNAIKWVMSAFAKLPGFVFDVMKAVYEVIARAASAIWQALSDALNPWQRHSPSLVDLVASGVDVILAKYRSLRSVDIGAAWRKAANDIQKFNRDARGANNAADDRKINANITEIAKTDPGSVGSAQALASDIRVLRGDLEAVTAAYAKQLLVVNQWQRALDNANDKLKEQQYILGQEQYKLDQISKALDKEKSALDQWASTPIKGMKAADDAIFANGQHVKELQLRLLKMEDTYGTLDGLKNRMSAIRGEMELINGKKNELRLKGAGSDVLAPFNEQLRKLGKQSSGIDKAISEMQKLQAEVEKLQHKGEELDLERSLKFDGLTRQIDEAAHSMKEMPFATIIANVKKHRAAVDELTKKYDKQNTVVEKQQRVVDRLQNKVDRIQHSYDAEKKKLDDLGNAYDNINSLIGEMTSALDSAAQSAKSASDALAQGFGDAAAGKFDTFDKKLKSALDPQSLDSLIKQWQKEWDKKFGKIDLLAPFKGAWHKLQDWWTHTAFPWIKRIPGNIVGALDSLGHLTVDIFKKPFVIAWQNFYDWWTTTAWPFLTSIPGKIGDALSGVGEAVKHALGHVFDAIVNPFKHAWKVLGGGRGSIPFQLGKMVAWFAFLPARLLAAVGKLGGMLAIWAIRSFGKLLAALPGAARAVMNWFRDLPQRMIDGIVHAVDFGGKLVGWISHAVTTLVRRLPDLFIGLINFFQQLPGKIWSAIGDLTKILWQKGKDLVTGFFKGIVNFLKDLPKKVLDMLGKVGGAAGDFFKGIWEGAKFWQEGGIVNVKRHITDEHHVAEIAPAGAMRVWAEPETGGEAYIPLSMMKRRRSLEILTQVAEIFKMKVMPAVMESGGGMLKSYPTVTEVDGGMLKGLPNMRGLTRDKMQLPGGMRLGSLASTFHLADAALKKEMSTQITQNISHNETTTHLHFNGDLSFPNIKSGDDAERFITNLEALVD